MVEVVQAMKCGDLLVEVLRGYVDDQFIRNRYTLLIETTIGAGDTRKAAWEFGNGEPLRFMGYTSSSEIAAGIAEELRAVADRFDG